ncbi:monooxygenase [Arsenicibacter rosenii]|uniref:Copper type II ascorbate-dependent monooxygenase C-terminal domain-containing protein n=1 Tax=Arsenicibacter rosenii TaxID=1750698 RepID=A0A1S2VJQ5_9BACT|nr:hypothetical protein [Arsenicibacter rosenii]OIN58989.1 hypothetical protein BLX24_12295 [Arsenicibacter rosenii]
MRASRNVKWIIGCILLGSSALFAQIPVYYQHVEPIITKNCAQPCHHAGGVGPFSLMSYEDVSKRGKFIAKVTEIRYMPPFPADRSFQHYANERGLTEEEITTIRQWVTNGMPRGNAAAPAPAPVRATPRGRPIPDGRPIPEDRPIPRGRPIPDGRPLKDASRRTMRFRMSRPYAIKGDGREDFRYFHVPMNLKEDIWVEAVEFIPGNRKRLHHSRLMIDSTGTMQAIDGIAEDDPKLRFFQQTPLADAFLYGWVPGNDRVNFPAGTAKHIKAGSDLILNIHYAPSPADETDQSEVILHLAPKPAQHTVQTLTLTENDVTNQPFLLPANTKPTFFAKHGPIQQDIQLISVLPHMHLLGKTFRAFAITPDGEAINLIKIDDWDYKWQLTYQFKELLTVPKGSIIIAEGRYDNTAQNPLNPNNPVRDVGYGWNSTDEMMNLVFYYIVKSERAAGAKE